MNAGKMAKTASVLADMGLPQNLRGFDASVEAVFAAANNPELLFSITGKLYPMVAQRLGITPSRVERTIRHAICRMYDMAMPEQIEKYTRIPCDFSKGNPTNKAFIAAVARYMRDIGFDDRGTAA